MTFQEGRSLGSPKPLPPGPLSAYVQKEKERRRKRKWTKKGRPSSNEFRFAIEEQKEPKEDRCG